MQYPQDQLESLRKAFQRKYKGEKFPSGETNSIYSNIKSELEDFAKKQSGVCFSKKSKKCNCISAKECKSYFPIKKSERLYASTRQLSQLLYSNSKTTRFWPGFIKLCCLFVKIPVLIPLETETPQVLKGLETEAPSTVRTSPLVGKWKYACTSFDLLYQHGGEFTIGPQSNGKLKLKGYRMWKKLRKAEGSRWKIIKYDELEYTHWSSVFIFEIDKEKFAFEYEIPQQNGNLRGYCSCTLKHSEDGTLKAEGRFYELNKLITGTIRFDKI